MRQRIAFDPRPHLEPEWTFSDRHLDRSREEAKGVGRWLAGKRVLDVGCGGGLLSEALARLGGDVIGVDASGVNIGMAVAHAAGDPGLPLINSAEGLEGGEVEKKGLVGSLEYRHTSAEALRDAGEKFDVVCAMEVVEHVDEPGEFMKALGDMVKVSHNVLHLFLMPLHFCYKSTITDSSARRSSNNVNNLTNTLSPTLNPNTS